MSFIRVVDSQSTCDKSSPLSSYISSSVAKSGYVCYNDNIYYLVDVVSLDRYCQSNSQGGQLCRDPTVKKLPGIGELDGSSWGGVTVEDLVVGYVFLVCLLEAHHNCTDKEIAIVP